MTDSITTPNAVLYLATWLPAHLHVQFSTWCDDHHRKQLVLPGFRRARRFEWIAGGRDDDPPQYLTMYDLDSLAAERGRVPEDVAAHQVARALVALVLF